MMSTHHQPKISPLLNFAHHCSKRLSDLAYIARIPSYTSVPASTSLDYVRNVKSQRNIGSHKQGLDITGAEDIRSHATTISGTAPTKYETHSCTSDGKKRQQRRKEKKPQAVNRERYQTKRNLNQRQAFNHSTNNTKQEGWRQGRLSRKQEKGWMGRREDTCCT